MERALAICRYTLTKPSRAQTDQSIQSNIARKEKPYPAMVTGKYTTNIASTM
jgi:hypothetical protein